MTSRRSVAAVMNPAGNVTRKNKGNSLRIFTLSPYVCVVARWPLPVKTAGRRAGFDKSRSNETCRNLSPSEASVARTGGGPVDHPRATATCLNGFVDRYLDARGQTRPEARAANKKRQVYRKRPKAGSGRRHLAVDGREGLLPAVRNGYVDRRGYFSRERCGRKAESPASRCPV